MDSFPKITIITPSYNQGQFIEQTIQSVINQNYPNLEYIIIDGGSTDNSLDVIKKYEKYLTYWISEPDTGQSDAINKGLKIATGEIINWLNTDDYYEPNALIKIAEKFLENNNTKVVCARSRLFKNQNETVGFTKGTDIYPNNVAKTIGWARIDQPETFFHRSAIEKMGLLDIELNYLMDRDWWIKYLLFFGTENVVKFSDIVVNFRLHNNSKTVLQREKFQVENDSWFFAFTRQFNCLSYADIIKENLDINEDYLIKKIDWVDQLLVKKTLNYFLLLRANEFYALNDKVKAKIFLNAIDLKLLADEDIQLWKKIYFRNKFILTPIINLFRK